MDEKFPVVNVIEQSIKNHVNSLVGNNDINLNTIIKMSLMNELNQLPATEKEEVLNRIASSNKVESFYVSTDYELTYDMFGNLVPINDIHGEKVEEITTDSSSIIPESRRSE